LNNIHEADLAGAYVLDALPPEQVVAFEDHLRTCAACRAEVAELSQVVDVLPLALDEVAPPAGLKERLLAEARGDTPARPALTALEGGAPPAQRRWTFRLPQTILAVAAVLLIAGLGIRVSQLQQQVNNGQAALQKAVVAALAAGAQQKPIAGTQYAPAASGSMVQPLHANTAYFVVKGLPATPSDKVYQLWLVKGKTPTSAGVFTYSGSGPKVVQVPMAASSFAVAAVTLERGPHGSSDGPTGHMLLAGKLSA
jgi:anti-sigma-K factor RskA